MPISDFVKTSVHGSFTIADGTGTPVTLTAAYDLGDVAVSGLSGPYLNEVVNHERRGNYVSSSYGARRYPTITFSAYLTGEGASAPGSLQAFLMKATPYGSNISTLGSGRVYAVKFTLNIEGTDFGDSADWSAVFNHCIPTDVSFSEQIDGNRFSITLTCVGGITGSLTTAEI